MNAYEKLREFVGQRPGFEFANYGSVAQYQADYRPVLRDLHTFKQLDYLRGDTLASLPTETWQEASRVSSGRLQWNGQEWDYTTGQYFPVEYRAAALAVAKRALELADEGR